MTKVHPRASFAKVREIASIYTGGKVAVTADEQLLVTAANDTVNVTDLRTGERRNALRGADDDIVTSFALRPHSAPSDASLTVEPMPQQLQLVSATRSLLLTLWNLSATVDADTDANTDNATQVRSWKAHEAPVIVMEFDPSGVLLATGSADSTVKLWDVDHGAACTHNLRGHSGVISALKFHPDGDQWRLFTGADDCQVRVWDLRAKQCVAVLDSHVSVIRGLDVTPCGQRLVSGSRDKVVNVWDLRSMSLSRTLPILESVEDVGVLTAAECRSFVGADSGSGDFIFTAGELGRVKVWRLADGKCVYEQPPVADKKKWQPLTAAFRTYRTNKLLAVSNDQTVSVHSLDDGMRCTQQIVGCNEEVIDVAFVGPRRSQLAVVTNTEQLRVYDLGSDQYDCRILHGHTDTILAMDTHSTAPLLATCSKDNTARIWRLAAEHIDDNSKNSRDRSCYTVAECVGHTESVGAVAMSVKSVQFLLTASQDHTVKKWDMSSLDTTSENNTAKIARLPAVYTVRVHEKDVNDVAVAPNDKIFATASQDRTAKLWSVDTGTELATLKGHKRGVWSVRFSPIDQVLATGSGDKTVKLWSLADYSCVRTFEGHTNSVLRVQFLTMGTQLLSAGSDGLTKLWTVKTSECETTLDDHDDKIWALAVREPAGSVNTDENANNNDDHDDNCDDASSEDLFSEKTCLLASGGGDALITIYRDVTVQALAELHEKEELRLLQDQALMNFIAQKDYRRAILLALELDQPACLCSLFTDVLSLAASDKDAGSVLGKADLDRVVVGLNHSQVQRLLDYIRTWNTNARHSHTAQAVLHLIVKSFTVKDLVRLPKMKELLDGIIPYTERHYARTDQLLTQSWLIDYSLSEMDALMADMDIETDLSGR